MVTGAPLDEIVHNQDTTRRITKWAIELMGCEIAYVPRTTIKSQVLANFVAKWIEVQISTYPRGHECWIMYFEGSVLKEGAGAGGVLISPQGNRLQYVVCRTEKATRGGGVNGSL